MPDDQPNTETAAATEPQATPDAQPGTGEPQPTPPASGPDHAAESRKWEKRSKDNHKALEEANTALAAEKAKTQAILVAAGLAPDTEDPAEAAKRALGERDAAATERDALRTEVLALKRDRLVESAARAAGADVDRVRDSRTVADTVRALAADATDADVAAAVTAAVTVADAQGARTVHPAFAALAAATAPAGRPPAAASGQGSSANPPPSREARAADAAKAGDHRTAIGHQIAKLTASAS